MSDLPGEMSREAITGYQLAPRPPLRSAPDGEGRHSRRSGGIAKIRLIAMLAVMVGAVGAVGAALWVRAVAPVRPPTGPPCRAAIGTFSFALEQDQAANASTLAAVGKQLGLPDHAVTIALATALQESKLHNVAYGDLDSLGLFQQRPSQGWGSPAQIMVPAYAATSFYQHLKAVPDWQVLPVTDAAQAVQHSAGPHAYARWEPIARLLAQVLTGQAPAGLTCRFGADARQLAPSSLARAMTDELGSPTTGIAVPTARGWTVAAWLVSHASQYNIVSVAFEGRRWGPATGEWRPDPAVAQGVQVLITPTPAVKP